MHARTLAAVAVAAALALTASACSKSDDAARAVPPDLSSSPAPASPSASPSPPPTVAASTDPTSRQAAQAVLDAFEPMIERIDQHPDPDDPELAQLTTGQALADLRTAFDGHRANGEAARPGKHPNSLTTSLGVLVDGKQLYFSGCRVDAFVLYNVRTGNTIDGDVAASIVSGFLVIEHGVWKIANLQYTTQITGATSC